MRINLGHIITLAAVIIGFVIQSISFSYKVGGVETGITTKVGALQGDVGDLKDSIKSLTNSQFTNAVTITSMKDDIDILKKSDDKKESHIEADDTRITALEKEIDVISRFKESPAHH